MENVDETTQPSKKRTAGVELSRDNPYHSFDDDENSDEEPKTFKKASDEVLAGRRIVKVRRNKPTQPTNNPFAGITLVPSSQSNSTEAETTQTPVTEEPPSPNDAIDSVATEPEANEPEPKDATEDVAAEPEANEPETKEDSKAEDEPKEKVETAPLSTFQQLSSSQNAFTGFSGTGFSASSFSFAALSKDNSSDNGSSSGAEKPSFPMRETAVETGEEKETVELSRDGALFEFVEGKWKERGRGEVKINVGVEGDKARLLMRARGNFRLILNANLYPEMKLAKMDKRGVSFACLNSAGDCKDSLATFALKFKDASVVEEFTEAVAGQVAKLSK